MIAEEAEALLETVLAPLGTQSFFAAIGKQCLEVKGSPDHPRRALFGADAKSTVLQAFATHASELDCHALKPAAPPPAVHAVASADEFRTLIGSFHERGFTVRVPDVVPLAPKLQRFARALEFMVGKPVGASLFWSAAGADAVVHYDKRDNLIVQLEGQKRWFISTDEPGLQNSWKQVGEPLPDLQRHRVVDVGPGDLLYIPRGTPHTVRSTTESLHLAILFEPITLRDVIIAAVDHLSDRDRSIRETEAAQVQHLDYAALSSSVQTALQRLLSESRSVDIIRAAMDLRVSRTIADLPPLPTPSDPVDITTDTRVRQSPLAISWLRPSFSSLDFSLPGGHIAVHPGVEVELRYMSATPAFAIADIPGSASDEVKIALVSRLVASGYLQIED